MLRSSFVIIIDDIKVMKRLMNMKSEFKLSKLTIVNVQKWIYGKTRLSHDKKFDEKMM